MGGVGYELAEEEKEYIENVTYIQDDMLRIAAEQDRLLQNSPRPSDSYASVNYLQNAGHFNDAGEMSVPSGCEDHYEFWLEGVQYVSTYNVTINKFLLTGDEEDLSLQNTFWNEAMDNLDKADKKLNRIQRQGCGD